MSKTSSEFGVGDLMWAKIGSYPYWPCIVSTSPGTQTFQKPAKKGSLLHVHFFGDNGKHSWVSSSSLMVFKGTEEFNKLKFKSGDTSKPQPGFLVKSNLKSAWDAAVKEIESVQKLDAAKRLDSYYGLYPLKMKQKGKATKRKDESSDEEVPAKITKSAPPKKAIKAAIENGDLKLEQVEESKPEVVEEPKSKKTKSAPPKKAIKAAVVESVLQNGEPEVQGKKSEDVEELKPEPVKLKKEPKNKKTAPPPESTKPEAPEHPNPSVDPTFDLKPILRKVQESLQVIIGDKKQLSIAKSLIEKVSMLAVNGELTDKTDVK